MLQIGIYEDVSMTATAYRHPKGVAPATVHVGFSLDGLRGEVGYLAISPDLADRLAAQLRSAADRARELDRKTDTP